MKPRIFCPGTIQVAKTFALPKEASHHLLTVLRMKIGEEVVVFTGDGGEFECRIEGAQKHSAVLSVLEWKDLNRESPLSIILAQGISRGERMDYCIQKATELGVTEIQPMYTEFCSVKLANDRIEKKVAHWQAIANSAAEQSGRTKVPAIKNPLSFEEILKSSRTLLIADPEKGEPIKSLNISTIPLTILIGPEGGFSQKELELAIAAGSRRIRLGPRILRTETAGLVALALLQNYFGDL